MLAVAVGSARTHVLGMPGVDQTADSGVNALAGSGSRGTRTGHWARFDASGARDAAWPEVDSRAVNAEGSPRGVRAVVPDGAGGWFIGGEFSHVAGKRRTGLAHVEAGGELDPAWAPAADGIVDALCVVGNTVYISGRFKAIDGRPRNGLAAVDRIGGRLRAWAPRPDWGPSALAAASGRIYVGGSFTRMGSARRKGLAAFDAATGALTAWNPGVTGRPYEAFEPAVDALLVAGRRLYVAGGFLRVAGRDRDGTAAFDAATGALTTWNPGRASPAFALAAAGGTVYIGGSGGVGAVDARTGRELRWWSDAFERDIGYVFALTVVGDSVYVGGTFTSLAGRHRKNLGVVSASTGKPIAWNPRPDNGVHSLAATSDGVLVGGAFSGFRGPVVR